MTIVLGDSQYGKAETHLVRITKTGAGGRTHEIKDLTVTTSLAGDFAASHLVGDNSKVVATDTQKNTVFAFAAEPIGEIEDFGLRLAGHFVREFASVYRARVSIEEHPWTRIVVDGRPHPFAFVGGLSEKRLVTVTCTDDAAWVVAGITDLVVLKSTGSEFGGFPRDRYTTLADTKDRILAAAVTARWRYCDPMADWSGSFAEVRRVMLETFAVKHSLALQQTLYAIGEAVLKARPEVAEIRLSMANKHHFTVDLSPFELDNDNEVFYASDRPYGLIEGAVTRDDAPEPGLAW
ncbi:MAG: factor-independent urate hydroxylase [Candidatus Dormibacteraceae bacterium]